MASCYSYPHIYPSPYFSKPNPPPFFASLPPIDPSPVAWCPPPPSFAYSAPENNNFPSYINTPTFVIGAAPEQNWSPHEPTFSSSRYQYAAPEKIWSPNEPTFSSSSYQYDLWLTQGQGLHDNSSSGASFADDKDSRLASAIAAGWVNISDAGIVNKPPADGNTQPDFTKGEGLHELHQNSSSGAFLADDDNSALTCDEHLGGIWVNISDAGIINKPTDDGGLNKPFGDVYKLIDTLAASNTSWKKETGGGGGGGGDHTCELGCGYRAFGSCGNSCYACGEADHFDRKCSLGAD